MNREWNNFLTLYFWKVQLMSHCDHVRHYSVAGPMLCHLTHYIFALPLSYISLLYKMCPCILPCVKEFVSHRVSDKITEKQTFASWDFLSEEVLQDTKKDTSKTALTKGWRCIFILAIPIKKADTSDLGSTLLYHQ